MRQCVKRKRPIWWTPEGVLERLQAGEYVGLVCEKAATEVGGSLTSKTLRADIQRWSESASWGEQFKDALKLVRHDNKGQLVVGKGWYGDFFVAMEQAEGDAELACKAAGVSMGIVLALIDKRNRCFDPDFQERFRIAEGERVGKVRQKFFKHAENGDGDPKVQQAILESHLPHLHGKKGELHVSGEVDHRHGFVGRLPAAVVQASHSRTHALTAGREEAMLPARREPDVVDAEEVVEVRAATR